MKSVGTESVGTWYRRKSRRPDALTQELRESELNRCEKVLDDAAFECFRFGEEDGEKCEAGTALDRMGETRCAVGRVDLQYVWRVSTSKSSAAAVGGG